MISIQIVQPGAHEIREVEYLSNLTLQGAWHGYTNSSADRVYVSLGTAGIEISETRLWFMNIQL